jgi:hypothetical protein
VNNTFAKNALAAGVVAALSYAQPSLAASLPPASTDVVVLGCSVPSAGTTVATVYSVDAVSTTNSTYTISLPTAVAVGSSCAGALAALGNTAVNSLYFAPNTSTAAADAALPVVQAIPGTGYALQEFTLTATATQQTGLAALGYIGCAAPGNTGATVYSVDTTNQVNASSIASLQALVGKPCSWALAKAASASNTGFAPTSVKPAGHSVLNINSNGYSLNQYTFQ